MDSQRLSKLVQLAQQRLELRSDSRFEEADKIRAELLAAGFRLRDYRDGTSLLYRGSYWQRIEVSS